MLYKKKSASSYTNSVNSYNNLKDDDYVTMHLNGFTGIGVTMIRHFMLLNLTQLN